VSSFSEKETKQEDGKFYLLRISIVCGPSEQALKKGSMEDES